MEIADDDRRQAARRIVKASVLSGLALPFALGILARLWLSIQGRPVVSWLEGLVMILIPTVLLVLPVYALFARMAFMSMLRTGDTERQRFKLRSALTGLTLCCAAMLLGLLIEGQLSLLVLLAIPFWGVCAAGAALGYWAGTALSRFR